MRVARRMHRFTLRRTPVRGPQVVWGTRAFEQFVRGLAEGLAREHLWTIYLDPMGATLGYEETAVGGLDSTEADVREILRGAILAGADGIVCLHNHLGNKTPSTTDRLFARRLGRACNTIGIELVGLLVVGDDGVAPFRAARGVKWQRARDKQMRRGGAR